MMKSWTKCTDRLPTEDAAYLIYVPKFGDDTPLVAAAWYNPAIGQDLKPIGWSLLPEEVSKAITHWMPMPAPPEKESDNDD